MAMAVVSSAPCYQMIRFVSMKRLVRVDGWMDRWPLFLHDKF